MPQFPAAARSTRALDRPATRLGCCVGSVRCAAAATRATQPRGVACRAAAPPAEAAAAAALASFSPESSVDEASAASSRAALSALGIAPVTDPRRQLFDGAHVSQWSPALAAYAPIGTLLALLRMAAWVGGIALDAPWFRHPAVVDAYMALLGVSAEWQDEGNIPEQRHVLVSNHVTVGDLVMLFQRPQRYVHLVTSALPQRVWATKNLPAILQPANKGVYLTLAEQQQQQQPPQQQQQQQQHEAMRHADGMQQGLDADLSGSPGLTQPQQHQQHAATASGGSSACLGAQPQEQQQQQQQQQPSVHLFPEGGMTNGTGMMKFSRGFMLFADRLPVVPVALRVLPAFPQVSCHTVDSSFLANLFWFSWQPWTVIQAKALPAMTLAPGESKAAFVQRVQLAIATELRVGIAELSIQQKRQLAGGGKGRL